MLFILNKSLQIVDTLANEGDIASITPFFCDEFKQLLENGAETFEFQTLASTRESQHLIVGNYIAFAYEGQYKLFNITEIEEEHTDNFVKTVYCEMAGIELINEIVRPVNIMSASLWSFLSTILADTDWGVGTIDLGLSGVHDINITDYANVYGLLQEHAVNTYGGEISFTVKIEGGRIVGKYINVYQQRGNSAGFRFSYSSNISSISRTVDSSNLATALIGIGKNGITFKEIQTSDKPLNQDFIADDEAYTRWSKNGSHILGLFKCDTESPQELLKLTRLELENRKNPKIKYELKTELLGKKDVNIGDTVFVVDHEFNPPIYLEARINELKTSFTDNSKSECTLSNFKEIDSNITNTMRALASQLEGYVNDKVDNIQIDTGNIKDGAVTTSKIGLSSITSDLIVIDAINANHIQANSIDATKIKVDSITSDKIKVGSIISDSIATGSITSDKIIAEGITSDKIAAGSVTSDKILAGSITSDKIAANSIDSTQIKAGAIDTGHIKAGAITADSAIIADGAITTAMIGTGVIGDVQIADGSITDAKIVGLTASKITAGKIDATDIEVVNLNAANLTVGTINGQQIAPGSITDGHIGLDAIQAKHIGQGVITSDSIAQGAITADKIPLGEIAANRLKLATHMLF